MQSGLLSLKLLVEESDDLGKSACADAEGALDQAGLAEYVAGEIVCGALALSERAHELEACDRRVGGSPRLEAPRSAIICSRPR